MSAAAGAGPAIAASRAGGGGMTASRQLRFAWRSLLRDLRAGELRVLALALVVAVASVTAVGFFTDRVGRAVERQAGDALAADLLATSGFPLPAGVEEEARADGLDTATHVGFPSVIIDAGGESQLVAVKAVNGGYPLRGALSTATLDAPDAALPADVPAAPGEGAGVPSPGTVWVAPQLAAALDLSQGETMELGAARLTVERVILYEPDGGQNFTDFAPRVLMNAADLDSAQLLGEGSRARYSLLVAGEPGDVARFRDAVTSGYPDELRLRGAADGSPQLQRALDRSRRFLGLASVVTVLLAGAAIALAVRHFAQRQADAGAIMRTLGASRSEVVTWLAARLALVALGASVVGAGIGWLAQFVLSNAVSGWFGFELPAPGLAPPLTGLVVAFVALAGFGMLPVVRAGRVNVMRVLKQDAAGVDGSSVVAVLLGVVAAWLVVYLLSRDATLSLIVVAGVVAMLLTFALFGRLMIRGVRRLAGPRFRLAVAGLERRAASSVVQLAAFGIGIMALLLISIVRLDLLGAWERDVPENAPNVFVVNIQPDQADGFAARLESQGIVSEGLFPMVRARLVAHDGVPVTGNDPDGDDGGDDRRGRREYNLSYAKALPASNEVVAGEWWGDDAAADGLAGGEASGADASNELSIDEEWAGQHGYALGDTLTFDSAGVETTGTITSLRKIDWESFDVNFFVLATPSMLKGLPSTFVTSFRSDENFVAATTGWAREFPGIATIDVGAVIARVKSVLSRAALAIQYVFAFTLAAGLCVLLAAVQSSQRERIRETALLRALGASHAQVRTGTLAEFAILGAIAGALAALFATLVAWGISRWTFELPYTPNPLLWAAGILGGAAGIALAGWLATRRVLETPPTVALQASG